VAFRGTRADRETGELVGLREDRLGLRIAIGAREMRATPGGNFWGVPWPRGVKTAPFTGSGGDGLNEALAEIKGRDRPRPPRTAMTFVGRPQAQRLNRDSIARLAPVHCGINIESDRRKPVHARGVRSWA